MFYALLTLLINMVSTPRVMTKILQLRVDTKVTALSLHIVIIHTTLHGPGVTMHRHGITTTPPSPEVYPLILGTVSSMLE
eukprot:10216047-Ditylum_brightwellii.AAC.1